MLIKMMILEIQKFKKINNHNIQAIQNDEELRKFQKFNFKIYVGQKFHKKNYKFIN